MTIEFKLTSPCKDCPFLERDRPFFSTGERAEEIAYEMLNQFLIFPCHKTCELTEADEGEGPSEYTPKAKGTQACAGALIAMNREGTFGRMHSWAIASGDFDPTKLDMDAEVPELDEWVNLHYDQ